MTAPAACTAACAALVAAIAAPGPADAAVVLEDGHVDVGARIAEGALRMQVKDGTAAWREPADVVLHARPAAATTVPASPSTGFLGTPGAPLWLLPQVQRAGVLWPGWSTEALAPAEIAGTVRWTLTGVEGPGSFALFTTGTFGSVDKLFDTSDGLPDTREIQLGTHAHGNWAFGAEGLYRLSFELRARRPSGETIADARAIAVTVGAVDPVTGAPLVAGREPSPGGGGSGGSDPGGSTGGGGSGPAGPGTAGGQTGASGTSGGARPAPAGRRPTRSRRPDRLRLVSRRGVVRLSGRTLRIPLRVTRRSRVRVGVWRGGRVVARAPVRVVGPRARLMRLRLDRRLARGTYRVRVAARSGQLGAAKTFALHVGRR